MFRKVIIAISAIALFAQPALAGSFNEASTAVWVARTDALIGAVDSDATTAYNIGGRLKTACKGLTGDIVKYGNNMPDWAKMGQQNFCAAGDSIAAGHKNKFICRSLKAARNQLDKADAAKDPQAVVESAGLLLTITNVMLEGFAEADRSCR